MILVEASGRSAVCICFVNMHNGLINTSMFKSKTHARTTGMQLPQHNTKSPDGYGSQIAMVIRTYIHTMQASGYWIMSIAKP